jgi:hypothetical protein
MTPGLDAAFAAIDELYGFQSSEAAETIRNDRRGDAMLIEADAVALRLANLLTAYMVAARDMHDNLPAYRDENDEHRLGINQLV